VFTWDRPPQDDEDLKSFSEIISEVLELVRRWIHYFAFALDTVVLVDRHGRPFLARPR
jgi:hypothetical protein